MEVSLAGGHVQETPPEDWSESAWEHLQQGDARTGALVSLLHADLAGHEYAMYSDGGLSGLYCTCSAQACCFGPLGAYWEQLGAASAPIQERFPERFGYEDTNVHVAEFMGMLNALRWRRPGQWNMLVCAMKAKEPPEGMAPQEHDAACTRLDLRLQSVDRDVQSNAKNLSGLTSEFVSTQGDVHILAERLEVAHDFLRGVGKGFQDAHKQVDAAPGRLHQEKPSMLPLLPSNMQAPRPSTAPTACAKRAELVRNCGLAELREYGKAWCNHVFPSLHEVKYIEKRVPKKIVKYVEKVVEVPQVIYEERAIEVPEVINVEAVTQVPRPHVQYVKKEVPKVVLQPQEKVVEVPVTLTQERPVEVPQVQIAELMVQVPKPEVEMVDKEVPKLILQPEERIVEVPQVFYEERLRHVPQVQIAQAVKEVPNYQKQVVQKHVPKIVETKVVEKVVPVPVNLVRETAVEVPKVVQHEVIRQQASGPMQQRIIQTGRQYQRTATKEEVVSGTAEAEHGGYIFELRNKNQTQK
ncbi:hypothetical protein AK812_SmicGene13449 [Symbiodinium microadriaticum]|uniref:Uncharacterized protein n=2 Tax=Symbiodinium TaxID=2949 RepID=A0A1Q9E831_SYMMI|nr:hypothetical protein AK812_SmicGene13449 [Symbiodinium microadriaticum]